LISLNYVLFLPVLSARNEINSNKILWENKVFKKGIKSVLIYKSGWELSVPVMNLNSDDKITLVFDELGNSRNDYSYSLIHCGSDWFQSEIDPMDYIDGHEVNSVSNYQFSQNTMVDYVNYWIEFPDDNCKPLVSGNYIIKVFEGDDPEKVVLTARFYVVDQKVEISANVEKIKIDHGTGLNQRVNFNLKFNEMEIENPTENLSFKISKNNEVDKDINNLKPSAYYGNTLEYRNLNALSFAGGNEFRHFDTKSFKFLSDRLDKIEKRTDAYNIKLITDIDKTNSDYKAETDLNGKYLVKLENNDRSHFMADYCYVNFELKTEKPLENGYFSVFGDLSKWALNDEFYLVYNPAKNIFEKQIFLKQGYFNYKYFFKPEVKDLLVENNGFEVEGNHFQSENDFHIMVYYKPIGNRYQELIGYTCINSNK